MSSAFEGVPQHWKLSRVDRVASVNARIGWKALTAAEYQNEGYAFLSTPNIKSAHIDFENVNFISEFRYEESPDLKLTVGDVLLAKDGNTLGIVNIVRDLPRPATVNGSIAILRSHNIAPSFLCYVIASDVIQGAISAVKDGMGVPHLFQWDIKRLPVPVPPRGEQQAIVDFLDRETGRIDSAIKVSSLRLALLEERFETLLDQKVRMASAQHGAVRLRHILLSIEQGWSPQCEERPAGPGEWGVMKSGCVNGGVFDARQHKTLPGDIPPRLEYRLNCGDLLMSRASGSMDLIGSVGIVPEISQDLLLCDKVYRLRIDPRRGHIPFVAHVLRSHGVREHIRLGISGGEGMANNLPSGVVKDCVIPAAPLDIQESFAKELDEARGRLAEGRVLLRREIGLLAERRRALITAAVTGQVDVTTARGVRVQ
ncbi:MAG TPA: restriction endonuclease subunit S [Streptomyces sp.]